MEFIRFNRKISNLKFAIFENYFNLYVLFHLYNFIIYFANYDIILKVTLNNFKKIQSLNCFQGPFVIFEIVKKIFN